MNPHSELVAEFESDIYEWLVTADSVPVEVLVVLQLHVIVELVRDDVVRFPGATELGVGLETGIMLFVLLCNLQERWEAHEAVELVELFLVASFFLGGVGELS